MFCSRKHHSKTGTYPHRAYVRLRSKWGMHPNTIALSNVFRPMYQVLSKHSSIEILTIFIENTGEVIFAIYFLPFSLIDIDQTSFSNEYFRNIFTTMGRTGGFHSILERESVYKHFIFHFDLSREVGLNVSSFPMRLADISSKISYIQHAQFTWWPRACSYNIFLKRYVNRAVTTSNRLGWS